MTRVVNAVKLNECEDLYIKQNKTFQEICALTGVSKTTLSKYFKEYGWKEKKESYLQSLENAQKTIDKQIADLTEKIDTTTDWTEKRALIYSLSQIINIKAKSDDFVEKRTAIYTVLEIFSEYVNQSKAGQELKTEIQKQIMNFLEEHKNA